MRRGWQGGKCQRRMRREVIRPSSQPSQLKQPEAIKKHPEAISSNQKEAHLARSLHVLTLIEAIGSVGVGGAVGEADRSEASP